MNHVIPSKNTGLVCKPITDWNRSCRRSVAKHGTSTSFQDGYSVIVLVCARPRHLSTTKWATRQYLNTCKHYGEDVKKKKEGWTSQTDPLLWNSMVGRFVHLRKRHTRNSDRSESNVRKISNTTKSCAILQMFSQILLDFVSFQISPLKELTQGISMNLHMIHSLLFIEKAF